MCVVNRVLCSTCKRFYVYNNEFIQFNSYCFDMLENNCSYLEVIIRESENSICNICLKFNFCLYPYSNFLGNNQKILYEKPFLTFNFEKKPSQQICHTGDIPRRDVYYLTNKQNKHFIDDLLTSCVMHIGQ